jgi:uncharacterized membrane protein
MRLTKLGNERRRPRLLDARDVGLVTVFSALMAVVTLYAIPIPFGGITHLGNTVMWTASILFGGLIGGLAGGIGGAIADLVLEPIWAPFDILCKLASGIACGLVSLGIKSTNRTAIIKIILAVIVGAIANLLAYAPVYWLLFGPGAAVLWLLRFLTPGPALVTYVATPIITIGVMKAYPRVLAFRSSRRGIRRFI